MTQGSLLNVKLKELRLNYTQQYVCFGTGSNEKNACLSMHTHITYRLTNRIPILLI